MNNVKNNRRKIQYISEIGLISALYATISLVLAPISFGVTQIRVAEALTILPVLKKRYIYAVTFGCCFSNLIGFFMGQNILGILDSVIGTFATWLSAFVTYYLRNINFKSLPILSTLSPVIINAFVIGAELTVIIKGDMFNKFFWVNFLSVFVGQFISCCLIGLILFVFLKKFILHK